MLPSNENGYSAFRDVKLMQSNSDPVQKPLIYAPTFVKDLRSYESYKKKSNNHLKNTLEEGDAESKIKTKNTELHLLRNIEQWEDNHLKNLNSLKNTKNLMSPISPSKRKIKNLDGSIKEINDPESDTKLNIQLALKEKRPSTTPSSLFITTTITNEMFSEPVPPSRKIRTSEGVRRRNYSLSPNSPVSSNSSHSPSSIRNTQYILQSRNKSFSPYSPSELTKETYFPRVFSGDIIINNMRRNSIGSQDLESPKSPSGNSPRSNFWKFDSPRMRGAQESPTIKTSMNYSFRRYSSPNSPHSPISPNSPRFRDNQQNGSPLTSFQNDLPNFENLSITNDKEYINSSNTSTTSPRSLNLSRTHFQHSLWEKEKHYRSPREKNSLQDGFSVSLHSPISSPTNMEGLWELRRKEKDDSELVRQLDDWENSSLITPITINSPLVKNKVIYSTVNTLLK